MRVLGAILAGGQASRFGSNKALALYRGRPLIAHVAQALGGQVDTVAICGGEPVLPGACHLTDRPLAGLGPLGGLAAALFYASNNGFDSVASVGCDTPLLPGNLINLLGATGFASYLENMPLIGWWPTGLTDALDAFLTRDSRRSMRGWAEAAGARPVNFVGQIANINTPDDLGALPC